MASLDSGYLGQYGPAPSHALPNKNPPNLKQTEIESYKPLHGKRRGRGGAKSYGQLLTVYYLPETHAMVDVARAFVAANAENFEQMGAETTYRKVLGSVDAADRGPLLTALQEFYGDAWSF